jgi:hypothetical protein
VTASLVAPLRMGPWRLVAARIGWIAALAVWCGWLLIAPGLAHARLLTSDNTPFARSRLIVGAAWAGRDYGPPPNQRGDILPTVWASDGNEYTIMDDGGTDVARAGAFWKQSMARITGVPPAIRFTHVGSPDNPPPYTRAQIRAFPVLWNGPLGPYYSSGLVEADHILFATQEMDWDSNANGLFTGLDGIAYSANLGQTWRSGGKAFPAPLGNLNWVIRGRGGNYPDGWVYAIASEREFDASDLIMGRSRPDVADMTDPASWQWVTGWSAGHRPSWANSPAAAVPIAQWGAHITYPQMAYDSPLHQYLLTFTYTYAPTPPAMWQAGSELVILTASRPWGPFSFVARQPYFGPSNGYGAGFPIGWISPSGRRLWLKWAANFDGCLPHLDCSGGYGFDYRKIQFAVAAP